LSYELSLNHKNMNENFQMVKIENNEISVSEQKFGVSKLKDDDSYSSDNSLLDEPDETEMKRREEEF
jgi:hypothetical protein